MANDALSKFIGGLQTLDPTNINAPANQDALRQFQSLPGAAQRDVLNGLAGRYGLSFDQFAAMPEADKARVSANIDAGRAAFDGVTVPSAAPAPAQQTAPQVTRDPNEPDTRSFEQKWADMTAKRQPTGEPYHPSQDTARAERYGEQAARDMHGHVNPEVQAQRDRIASIRAEANATGKSFGEVADARVAAGQ